MRVLRRITAVGLVVIAAMVLPGCSSARFISLRYSPGESLEFFVPLCGDEHLQGLRLDAVVNEQDPSEDKRLWDAAIDAAASTTGRVSLERASVLTSLAESVGDGSAQILVVTASTPAGWFSVALAVLVTGSNRRGTSRL